MKKYILISLITCGVSFLYGQTDFTKQPIEIRLDQLESHEKEGIFFSINKKQKVKGATVPLYFSIEDSTAIYVIVSTGFAYGRGFLKEDGANGQYCEPILQAQQPVSYWALVVPAYSNSIPKTLYLRLEISKYTIATKKWERATTRIPVSILIEV